MNGLSAIKDETVPDLNENQQAIGAFQVLVAVICFLIVAIDGFDTATIGFLAPAIRAEWNLTPLQLAPVFGAGLFGLMIGAFVFGPLADRFGRKTVLLFCVSFFGLACLASATADSLWVLVVLRFLTGLGIGGAMPNAVTLTSEYCSERHRLFIVTTMFCGFTVGSALGGLASAQLVGSYGWRSVLVLGGVAPLVLLPLMAWRLPESVRFLTHKPERLPLRNLFRPNLIRGTLMLWVTFFMSLLIIYLLSSWLPTLLGNTGVSLKTASLVTMMFQVGGTTGAILLGWLMDRLNPHWVLAGSYAAAGLFIAAMGSLTGSPGLVALAVFGAGLCISGSQTGANALAASFYPTDCRATGVSWANGVGRGGSVIGSTFGGAILATGLPLSIVFIAIAIPALIAGATMFGLGRYRAAIEAGCGDHGPSSRRRLLVS
jgi:AAHS family 4-hydroxybenzoate transporter-like MFS transporter